MAIISFVLVWIVGFLVIQTLAGAVNVLTKIGLSFPVGIGLTTVIMFMQTVLLSKIELWVILVVLAGLAIGLYIIIGQNFLSNLKIELFNIRISPTFAWFFVLGLVLYLLYGIGAKNLYWPPAEYDTLTGYDLQAKMIAKEGTFKTSQFDYPYQSAYDIARFIYPPLNAAAFAFAYMLGLESGKSVVLWMFISLVVAFYGLLRQEISDTWAILCTLFMMVTPEMFSHASLALINLPNAVYVSVSALCLYYYLKQNIIGYLYLSIVLMGFANWSRSDSIIFIPAAILVMGLYGLRKSSVTSMLIFAVCTLIPFVAWMVYVKLQIGANSADFFVKYLFWDVEKLRLILSKCMVIVLGNGVYYGITFFVFVAIFALNIVDVVQTRNPLALFIMISWIGYTFLYYQIDYNFAGNIDAYINASYKRGMFNFVPMCWFFTFTSPFSLKWLSKADEYFNK